MVNEYFKVSVPPPLPLTLCNDTSFDLMTVVGCSVAEAKLFRNSPDNSDILRTPLDQSRPSSADEYRGRSKRREHYASHS